MFLRLAFGLGCGLALSGASLTVGSSRLVPGALAQLRLELDQPLAVAIGGFTITLPAEVFGPIADVQVFSAAGDALGSAKVSGNRAVVSFSSISGGIGRVNGLPVAMVTAPVLATAVAGVVAVEVMPWKDPAGATLEVLLRSEHLAIGGSLAIESVVPIATDTYRMRGRGFTAATRLTAPGLPVSPLTYRSPTEIEFRVAGPVELTGQLLEVLSVDGEHAHFVYALETMPSGEIQDRVFVPVRQLASVNMGMMFVGLGGTTGVALENPHPVPVELWMEIYDELALTGTRKKVTLPPLSRMTNSLGTLGVPYRGTAGLVASLPIRAATFSDPVQAPEPQPLRVQEAYPYTPFSLPEQPFSLSPNSLSFTVSAGATALPEQMVNLAVAKALDPIPLSVSTSVPWLIASSPAEYTYATRISVRVAPGTLAPGQYSGLVTVTAQVANTRPQLIPVTLTIRAAGLLSVEEPVTLRGLVGSPVLSQPLVLNNDSVVPVSLRIEPESAGTWLSAVQRSSVATLIEIKADPAGRTAGRYQANVVVAGPVNRVIVPVTLVLDAPAPTVVRIAPTEIGLEFQAGDPEAVVEQMRIQVSPVLFRGPAIRVSSDRDWVTVAPLGYGVGDMFVLKVDARFLAVGEHVASIKVTYPYDTATGEMPVHVRIWGEDAPAIRVEPASLSLMGPFGSFEVLSEAAPVPVRVSVESRAAGCELGADFPDEGRRPQVFTPVKAQVFCSGPPGFYEGSLRVTGGGRVVLVPVSIRIPALEYAGPVSPPVITAVTQGASNAVGPVVAGSAVTLHGVGRGRSVTFDGLPALVFYESLFQANVIVPAGVAGRSSSTIRVVAEGSAEFTLPVVPFAPGIFTLDGTGRGQGAILNQDNMINGAEYPAAPGSIVQIFATGISSSEGVSVTMGGMKSSTVFAGQVALGLFQINAVVPAVTGPVALRLEVGGVPAQTGVSLMVR